MADERLTAVLVQDEGSFEGDVARALRRGLGAEAAPEDDDGGASPIALPLGDDEAAPLPVRVEKADLAIVLDPPSLELARRAGVPEVVALWSRLDADWDGELDADLVLVCHDALVDDAVRLGVPRKRVVPVGPVAPDGWSPADDRAALREARELPKETPIVVVRAEALARDDLAPALVQLSLVSREVLWLFDVGRDPELARSLRRHVPGYGLDAIMFADGDEALPAYQLADLVLGSFDGPEAIRAFAVGAGLVSVPPRRDRLRLAHAVETAELAEVADAGPTLAVTLEAALAPTAMEAARQASERLDAVNGVARVVAEVRALMRGERGGRGLPVGLPQGLERLSDAEEAPSRERPASEPPEPGSGGDLDEAVDEELERLREKLGL